MLSTSAERTAVSELSKLRIIDISNSVAGQFAGRIFADYGAEVVLVEPQEGSTLRQEPPFFPDAGAYSGESLLFFHLNAGKRSITVDVNSPNAEELLKDLCEQADAVILDDGPLRALVLGSDYGAAIVDIKNFRDDGPYANWAGEEIIYQALSGLMNITGLPDREPLYGAGLRTSYAAGAYAFIGAAAMIHQRLAFGVSPKLLEISLHEAASSMEQNLSTQWSYSRTTPLRGKIGRPKLEIECQDGWVSAFINPHEWPLFCEAFNASHLAYDPRFSTAEALETNWGDAVALLREHARLESVHSVTAAGLRLKIVLGNFTHLSSLRSDPQLVEREFWIEDDGVLALGPIARTSVTPVTRGLSAPDLGELQVTESLQQKMIATSRKKAQVFDRFVPRPLHGIRVIDMASAWAGPMTCRLLANLGADVIKVEGPTKLDAWRFGVSGSFSNGFYPDSNPGEDPWNRSAWFNSQNHDKRGLGLDIKTPIGRQILENIVKSSDVLVANWSPGALKRAGLDYSQLTEINPELILVEMPAAGNSGPMRDTRGLGPTMEAFSGIGGLIGYEDGQVTGSGAAYNDPMGALHGTLAVLIGLLERDLSGRGQYIEVAQQEAAMHWIGELILDATLNQTSYGPQGNSVDFAAPHGAFPASGTDEWIAISIRGQAEWDSMCALLDPTLAANAAYRTFEQRKKNEASLYSHLATITSKYEKHYLAHRLQKLGVPAAPVVDGADLYSDPQLRAHSWFSTLTHQSTGTQDYPGLPFVFDGSRYQPTNPSPAFGQHNYEFLTEELGASEEDLDRWLSAGVIAWHPKTA